MHVSVSLKPKHQSAEVPTVAHKLQSPSETSTARTFWNPTASPGKMSQCSSNSFYRQSHHQSQPPPPTALGYKVTWYIGEHPQAHFCPAWL